MLSWLILASDACRWQVNIERAEQLGMPSDVVCRLAVSNRWHSLSVCVPWKVSCFHTQFAWTNAGLLSRDGIGPVFWSWTSMGIGGWGFWGKFEVWGGDIILKAKGTVYLQTVWWLCNLYIVIYHARQLVHCNGCMWQLNECVEKIGDFCFHVQCINWLYYYYDKCSKWTNKYIHLCITKMTRVMQAGRQTSLK